MSARNGDDFGGLGSIPDIDRSRYLRAASLVMAGFGYNAAQHFQIVRDQAKGIMNRR
jgi:hypothetical protein